MSRDLLRMLRSCLIERSEHRERTTCLKEQVEQVIAGFDTRGITARERASLRSLAPLE